MKITDNTDDMLIVDDKPLFAGLAMAGFGLVFGAMGVLTLPISLFGGVFLIVASAGCIFGFYWLIERTQIVFHRPGGTVEFRRRSLRRYSRTSYPLSEITGALVDQRATAPSSSFIGGGGSAIRILLFRKNKAAPLPFTSSYSTGSNFEQVALAVNTWLAAG